MSSTETVFVVGGDGFCGWPLALRLSSRGYHVVILDNLSRRRIDTEQGTQSLVPIATPQRRVAAWLEQTGRTLDWVHIDLAVEYERWEALLLRHQPSVVVHLGEQRSAPYSMRESATARYTVSNNLNATHNILCGLARNSVHTHLVHIGTMGVYGYGAVPDSLIPEGYLDTEIGGQAVSMLHPAYPGSIYHLSKAQDALMFQFYAKNYNLRITDLHQGIIWGCQTAETRVHPDLANRVDYDEAYGTVLNRFLIQAATSRPLSVYGTGGQTRAFIHLSNSGDCIELAMRNPPAAGDRVKIYNQMTQTLAVGELAQQVATCVPGSTVEYVDNPRRELATNSLSVCNRQFLDEGLVPVYLDEQHIREMVDLYAQHATRCGTMCPTSKWSV
jgi:UDP-sulfoquinovose synthase